MTPERDWERLGRAFATARKAADLSQVEVAEQLHVSRTAIQAIERGRQSNGTPFIRISATMRAYARLMGWTEDSPALIADGGEPATAATAPAGRTDAAQSDLPPEIDLELRNGKTFGSTVVHLGPEEDDSRIIVVLKGAENLSEEELDKLWQQWRKTRRHLQAIPGESDTPQET